MRQRLRIVDLNIRYNRLIQVGTVVDEVGNTIPLDWNIDSGILWMNANRHRRVKKTKIGEARDLRQLAKLLKALARGIKAKEFYNYVQREAHGISG